MFHLLVMACTEAQLCAERWLPAFDSPAEATCAAADAGPWLAAHAMTTTGQRCVPTEALPAMSLDPVAPGVWVHRGADGTATPANAGRIANIGVVIGPRGAAVIDTGGSRAEAEALMAAVRRLTPLPVTAAILTHVHPDHSLGTGFFHEAGVPIIAHARLPEALAARQETYEVNYRATIGEAAWHGSSFAMPDRTVAAPEDLDIGGTTLRLLPQPTAHTDSDLMVWHADSGTLFAGDIAFRDVTPTLDGSLLGWLGVLGEDPAPALARVVPGHGPLATGWAEATGDTRGYLQALAQAVRAAIAANRPLSAAIPAITEALRPAEGRLADFDDTTRRDAAAAFKELEWE